MNVTNLQISPCSAYIPLNNYLVFNDVDGLYTYTFEAERKVSSAFFVCLFFLYIHVAQQ